MDFRFAISITNSTVSPSFFSPFFLFSVSACERDSPNRIRPGNRDDMTSAFCTDAPATASKRNKLEPVCPSKLLSRTWSSGLVRRQQLQLAFFLLSVPHRPKRRKCRKVRDMLPLAERKCVGPFYSSKYTYTYIF